MKLLTLAVFALPLSLFAEGGLPIQPYIYVEGKAEVEKPADMVTLRFSLSARNADQAKANQEVQANAAKVLGMLDARTIAKKDVIASDLESNAEYEDDESRPRSPGRLIGYRVTRRLSAKIRDITIFPKLVDELLAIPGSEFAGVDAGLSNDKQMESEVWEKALTNARERAERTLTAMSMKIDSVFAVSPVAFPKIHPSIFGTSEQWLASAAGVDERSISAQYRLPPVEINQSVHVIYLISPAK